MKKSLIIAFIVTVSSFTVAQNKKISKVQGSKWFANIELGNATIILSKTNSTNSSWEANFDENGKLTFCSVLKSALLDKDGNEVQAGTHYCDPLYTGEMKNNILQVSYPLVDWKYKVKQLKNGDLELQQIVEVEPSSAN